MILKRRYIRIVGLFFLFCLSACDSEIPDDTVVADNSEKVVLRLNVQHESVVQTRATNVSAEDEKIESVDFLVFNNDGEIVLHQHPSPEWTGTEYIMTVDIPSASGEHTLYLVANHSMAKGTIHTLKDLEEETCGSTEPLVSFPFVMATSKITLSTLSATAVLDVMNVHKVFDLRRNVAKFSVEVTADNFKLSSVQWIGCSDSASVLTGESYTSPLRKTLSNPAPTTNPIYLYQIPDISSDPHQGFHVIVSGEYTAIDDTRKEGCYKLRLATVDSSGNKVPLTSIVGNNYYKLNIRSVSGFGASSLENAEQNGFTNEMEALTMLNYTGSHSYKENYLRNGYQMGFESAHWIIYNDEIMNTLPLGYFYRSIREQSLNGYTTFDPDYPNLNREVIKVGDNEKFVTGMITCNDTPNKPVEMRLYFSDLNDQLGTGYVFTGIIQYGVLQKEIIIERKPSIGQSYAVLPMLNTYYGEVIGDNPWIGIAEQRHEGTTLYQQIDSDNDYIFIHVQKNDTGEAREGTVRLLGRNGYYELRIHQNG